MNENSTMNTDPWKEFEFDLDQAWVQMRNLLNKELPVQQRRRKTIAWLWWTRMAALFIIGISIAVGAVQFYSSNDKPAIAAAGHRPMNDRESVKPFPGMVSKNDEKDSKVKIGKHAQPGVLDDKANGQVNSFFNRKMRSTIDDKNLHSPFTSNEIGVEEKMDASSAIINDLRRISNTIPPRDSARTLAASAKSYRRAGVELGLYYNTGTQATHLYPVAKYHFPVGKKTSLSAGIALYSTITPKDLTVKEFIVLNDTANQVYFNVRNTSVNKITYLDLPLQLHYAIDPHWSLSAGLQLSVLQQSSEGSQNKSFGFLSDPVDQVGQSLLTMAGYQPYHTYTQEYDIYKTNWRMLAGVSYHLNKKASLTIQYQRGITDSYSVKDFNGERSGSKVAFVSVGAMYKF